MIQTEKLYYLFWLSGAVTRFELIANGNSNNFGFAVIEIKNGAATYYQRDPSGYKNSVIYMKTYTPGEITQVAVVVMGIPGGGPYSIVARAY